MEKLLVWPIMTQVSNKKTTPVSGVVMPPSHYRGFESVGDQRLLDETRTVAALRRDRVNNDIRTVRLEDDGFDASSLVHPRDLTWQMAMQLLEDHPNPDATGLYALRSQAQFMDDSYADINVIRGDTHPTVYLRSEEGLLARAEELIDRVKSAATARSMASRAVAICSNNGNGDCLVRSNQNGTETHIALRGYAFTPLEVDAGERRIFEHFPSCAVFLGAAAMEQLSLADHAIRTFGFGIKRREYVARDLCRLAYGRDLPIDSVSMSDDGTVNKLLSWHSDNQRKHHTRDMIRRASRYTSGQRQPEHLASVTEESDLTHHADSEASAVSDQ